MAENIVINSTPVITWSTGGYGSGTSRQVFIDGQYYGTQQVPSSYSGRDDAYFQSQYPQYKTPEQLKAQSAPIVPTIPPHDREIIKPTIPSKEQPGIPIPERPPNELMTTPALPIMEQFPTILPTPTPKPVNVITWEGSGYGSGTSRTLYTDGHYYGTMQIPESYVGRDEQYIQSQVSKFGYQTPSQVTAQQQATALAAEQARAAEERAYFAAHDAQQSNLLSGFQGAVASGEIRSISTPGISVGVEAAKASEKSYAQEQKSIAQSLAGTTKEEAAAISKMLQSPTATFASQETMQKGYDIVQGKGLAITPEQVKANIYVPPAPIVEPTVNESPIVSSSPFPGLGTFQEISPIALGSAAISDKIQQKQADYDKFKTEQTQGLTGVYNNANKFLKENLFDKTGLSNAFNVGESIAVRSFQETRPTYIDKSGYERYSDTNQIISPFSLKSVAKEAFNFERGMFRGVEEDPALALVSMGVGGAFGVATKVVSKVPIATKAVPIVGKYIEKVPVVGRTLSTPLGLGSAALVVPYGASVVARVGVAKDKAGAAGRIVSTELIPMVIGAKMVDNFKVPDISNQKYELDRLLKDESATFISKTQKSDRLTSSERAEVQKSLNDNIISRLDERLKQSGGRQDSIREIRPEDLVRNEVDLSVPEARVLYPYGRFSKLTDRISTPGENLVEIPRARIPGETINFRDMDNLKPSKYIEPEIPKARMPIEPKGMKEGKVYIKKHINAELKAQWEEKNINLEKQAKSSGFQVTEQGQILLMEKPELVKIAEQKKISIQKQRQEQRQIYRQEQRQEQIKSQKQMSIFSVPILESVKYKNKEQKFVGLFKPSVIQNQEQKFVKTTKQVHIQPQQQIPKQLQNFVQIPKQISIIEPIQSQIPTQVQIQPPIQIQPQVQKQQPVQYPRPYLDLYYNTGLKSEIPLDLPFFKDGEKQVVTKKRKFKPKYKPRASPIFEGAEKLFENSPLNPLKTTSKTTQKGKTSTKPITKPTFDLGLFDERHISKKKHIRNVNKKQFWSV